MPAVNLREPVPAELRASEFVLRPIAGDDSSWPEVDSTVLAIRADLAALGRNMTVPQFAQPTELQRDRLIALLPLVWPETWRESHVAFAAGLRGEA